MYQAVGKKNGVCPSTVGTISEMVVAVELMKSGWSVFKSLSPASAFDLIAFKNGEMKKIEVKTGYRVGGNIQKPRHSHNFHDHFAVVVNGSEINYTPEFNP